MGKTCLNFLIITIILAHVHINPILNLRNISWILADSNYVNFKKIISSSRCLAHTIPSGIAVNLIKFSSVWKQRPLRECILQCEKRVIQKLSYQKLWRVAGWVWACRTTGEDEVSTKGYHRTQKRMGMRRTVGKENKNCSSEESTGQTLLEESSGQQTHHFTILVELPHPLVPLNHHIAQIFHHEVWLSRPHFIAIGLVVCFLLLSSNI